MNKTLALAALLAAVSFAAPQVIADFINSNSPA